MTRAEAEKAIPLFARGCLAQLREVVRRGEE
jgi:hypothetical protein